MASKAVLVFAVGLAVGVLLLMASSAAHWDAALRNSVVPLDRLAQSRQFATQAELFAERLLHGDPAASPELVLASLERATHAGRALVDRGGSLAGMREQGEPSVALRAAVANYLVVLESMAERVRNRVRLPASASGLFLRELHGPLRDASLKVEEILLTELAYRRTALREMGLFVSALVAALMLGIILVRYHADLARDAAQRARRRSDERNRLHATALEGTRDAVIVTDPQTRILSVNRAFSEITGYTEAEAIGNTPLMLQSGRHDEIFFRNMRATLMDKGYWQGEIWNRHKEGEISPHWMSVSAVCDEVGRHTHYVGVLTDLSQLHRFEARASHLARFDSLTDLPNRMMIASGLEHSIESGRRDSTGVAVLFIDLDRFKHINDALGYDCGDQLLAAVARRLLNRVRNEDTLGRYGGDEFVLVLDQVRDAAAAASVARDLLSVFDTPFEIDSQPPLYIKASIGISVFPDDGDTAAELIRDADAAMNQAKRDGRNTFRYYQEQLTRTANTRLALESRLRRALDQGGFEMHYQPLVLLETGVVIGAEALVRLRRTDEPPIGPADFIPVMEESGMIVELGHWVQREVCRQGRCWLDEGYRFELLALNLSPEEVSRGGVVEHLKKVLAETGFPPGLLELEITESGLIQRGEAVVEFLHELKALGVRLAIDDFGTGYSSLSYLKRFPVNKLKIDRSFIMDLPGDTGDAQLTTTIIQLAHNLGLRVLAEGVETEAQRAFLSDRGCHAYQGYLCSAPLPAQDFATRFLGVPSPEATT